MNVRLCSMMPTQYTKKSMLQLVSWRHNRYCHVSLNQYLFYSLMVDECVALRKRWSTALNGTICDWIQNYPKGQIQWLPLLCALFLPYGIRFCIISYIIVCIIPAHYYTLLTSLHTKSPYCDIIAVFLYIKYKHKMCMS